MKLKLILLTALLAALAGCAITPRTEPRELGLRGADCQ